MTKKKIAFYTLGCRVNQYETRAVEEEFIKRGFEIGDFSNKCDVYIINTCTVTGESDRKSRQMVRRAIKNGGSDAIVAVVGCMTEVDEKSAKAIDGVDIILGNGNKMNVVDKVELLLSGSIPVYETPDVFSFDQIERMSVTGSDNTRAFLKVVDGCENKCSYCIIPKARGKVRSKPVEEVLEECNNLTNLGGCREIVLTGIETAAYGCDLGTDLATLVEKVAQNNLIKRIRLGSLEPTVLKEDFVKRLSQIETFMPHFHLSLQSGCDSVLSRMRRKYNTKMFLEKLSLLRKYFPDCQITTDIIVGFPGETEEEFTQTLSFLDKCRFLYIHIFPYSDRAGTEASRMENKIDLATKTNRCAILNKRMNEIRKEILESHLGKEVDVLCETTKCGLVHGYTPNFIETRFKDSTAIPNDIKRVTLDSISQNNEFVLALLN